MSQRPPAECAHCGTAIPPRARACPECGADERTGWREASIYDGLDLPESAWRDDTETPPEPEKPRVNGLDWYWWVVAVMLLILLGAAFLGRR